MATRGFELAVAFPARDVTLKDDEALAEPRGKQGERQSHMRGPGELDCPGRRRPLTCI